MKFDELIINKVYSNKEVMDIFSCSRQGGIRVSNTNKAITIISKLVRRNETNPYQDEHMNFEGRITYTGMGTVGDQKLSGQNLKIAESRTNGYRMFYFEVYQNNEYTFKGEVILDDEPYFVDELDLNDVIRKVLKFKLKVKTPIDDTYIAKDIFNKEVESKEKEIKKLTSKQLANQLVNMPNEVRTTKVLSEQYNRDLKVKQYTLRRANGKCDLCDEEAPFKTDKDEPYLESHHVIPLSQNGKDSIVNTVALCPNCHKKMHYGKERNNNLQKLKEKLRIYSYNDNNFSHEKQLKIIEDYKKNFGIED